MQRIGIFGGTFSPPHSGHIYIASEAMRLLDLDKIIFIPCGNPPHKDNKNQALAKHRFQMTKLAIEGIEGFEISDIEVRAREKSYTANTLKKIKPLFPDAKLSFIVGGDAFLDMEGWYHPKEIFSQAEVIAVSRGGVSSHAVKEKAKEYEKNYDAQIRVIDISALEVSSSKLREKIIKNQDVSKFIKPEVLEYIREFKVYKDIC